MQTSGKERRLHARIPLSTRCWCEGGGATLYVNIVNASAGGLFIRTQAPFSPGEAVTVRWHFPDDPATEHNAAAQVVWKRQNPLPPGMGLKFTEVKEETAKALKTLALRSPTPPPPAAVPFRA
ncbi:MAG: PilZ domain-containing protein [Deltaproteobacteria bacterium]|nr:PilZ domain-containing protein [Deltaproteobacteria bacterium]